MNKLPSIPMLFALITILFIASCGDQEIVYHNPDLFVEDALKIAEGISVSDLKTIVDTAEMYLILDVREPNEHNPGYIPGSVNIPRGILEFNIGKAAFWESKYLYEPVKDDLIILYCKKGKRGIMAAATLEKMGYSKFSKLFADK